MKSVDYTHKKIKQMSYSAADTRHTDYRETERGLTVPNKSTYYQQKKKLPKF